MPATAISVIIPTLQEEKLIGRTLRQFPEEIRRAFGLEVIVSDGGSTDRTLLIAREHADLVLTIREGQVQNISRGRNEGARAAKGDILVFINADTVIEQPESFFRRVVESVRAPGITGVTCAVRVYPEEEKFADRLFHGFYNRYFSLLNLCGMGMGRGECHVVSREMFFSVGGYNESIAAGEDFDLFLRLGRNGKIAFLRELRVFESPRRYRKYGYLRITLLWFLNAVWVVLFKKSLHAHWVPVR